jgi:choline dehydrogenase
MDSIQLSATIGDITANQPHWVGLFILARGKLVGGCSATNAAVALRGAPSDYEEWVECGNPGWSFAEVLPFFRRLESDADFDDQWHGRDGPLPIRRDPPETLLPEHRAFLQACSALGYSHVIDHNSPGAIGAGVFPRNVIANVRQSGALTYLSAARGRPNLTIRSNILVDYVIFEGQRAVGVRLRSTTETIRADRIILAAGVFGSPAILMRSGLGPANHLKSMGINVLNDLPGVGQNLSDHPLLALHYAAPAGSENVPGPQAILTLQSPDSGIAPDLQIFPWTISPAEPGASPIFEIFVALMKPLSHGSLHLSSSDPSAAPVIDLGLLTNPRDMPRIIHALRVARQLAKTSPLSDVALQELIPGPQTSDAKSDLEAAVRSKVSTYYHPVGTCRMGPVVDASAVVDSRGKVHTVENLFVIDASIMPTIPTANTNLPTLMLAERCSVWLVEAG